MHLHLISSEGVSNFLSLNCDLLLPISTNILFIFGAPATRRLQIIEDGRVDFHARFLFDHLDCHTFSLVSDIVYPISLPVFNILGCSSSFICDLFSGSCRNCSLKYPLIAINIIIAELKRDFLGFICYLLQKKKFPFLGFWRPCGGRWLSLPLLSTSKQNQPPSSEPPGERRHSWITV